MPPNRLGIVKSLRFARVLYLFIIALSFYLLFMSRSGEVYTVWEVMHPFFIPMFFASTFLLSLIILSSERTEYKLLFTILHSVLSHTLMIIIFPAGNVGVQQMMLGKTRLVFDNVLSPGSGMPAISLPLKIYYSFRGDNFQTAFSVIFARMFGVDVYWSHLLLVPLLWGIFVPVAAFMMTKALGRSDNTSILSSLMISLFPANIIWGAVSISNGLGYLFFFLFIYFLLKYINSNRVKDFFLVTTFLFISFLSHYLAGTVAFSLLLLANSIKTYQKDKTRSLASARSMLLLAFIFCASILPFALAYRRFFYPWANTSFSLQKLFEAPFADVLWSLLLGSYFDLISREAYFTAIIYGVASLVSLIGMVCILGLRIGAKNSPKRSINPALLFLFLGSLMVIADDRIVRSFMINVPFIEIDRLWLFRDFTLLPFLAIFVVAAMQEMRTTLDRICRNITTSLRRTATRKLSKKLSFFARIHLPKNVSLGSMLTNFFFLAIISGWATLSVYYAYPHWSPLQTTSYELEAVKYIKATTNETYIVVCDSWMTYAGAMIVGIHNPQAYYFSSGDPHGVTL
ncbi:MAG: glycosyltransferase family 39 protein, partial [Candidatus Bathyarchaeota archaeon]|nr:glycosyltransferase family 39 protein [Candidatus Bathyarchaeota archaeon]